MNNMFNLYNKFFEDQQKLISGITNMMDIDYSGSDATEKEMVLQIDKMKLYHYEARAEKLNKTPVLISYALVNKQYMMDIQEDRSLIRNLLDNGQDIYIIDWGYPTEEDMYLTMDDYINGYLNSCVDFIRKSRNIDKINLLGVCQGGTFSLIYTALNPDKIKNLLTLVTPLDFSTNDGLLFKWGKYLNIGKAAEAYGVIPGDFMNAGFLMLKPFDLAVDKYLNIIPILDDSEKLSNFLRMEKWIFDSPGQAGATIKEFTEEMYHKNALIKGEFELNGVRVDLKNIKCPVLVILGKKDNQVPPAATRPIVDAVGSDDVVLEEFDTGHIGIFVSGRSQKEVAPKINEFLNNRD